MQEPEQNTGSRSIGSPTSGDAILNGLKMLCKKLINPQVERAMDSFFLMHLQVRVVSS